MEMDKFLSKLCPIDPYIFSFLQHQQQQQEDPNCAVFIIIIIIIIKLIN